ncbi:MAG: hypothetical protein LBV71_11490 [Prevotella sp.]|jgi:hypothetical protein|nr:hypothetical protein [Prevotella sp.]
MFKQLLLILCFICIYSSCTKENHIYEEFAPPTFEILSCEILSADECIIEVEVNCGVGAKLHSINIELNDITDNTNEAIHKSFSLNEEENQIVKAQIRVPNEKHDYRTLVTLKSTKNVYDSNPFFLRFSEEFSQDGIKYIYFSPSGFHVDYVDGVEKIALNLKKGQQFYFMVEYSKLILKENSIQVKLNGKHQLEVDPHSYGISYDGEIGIHCTLPNDIAPGVYDVHVYINDLEYILDYKIKILRGSSEILYIDSRPGKDGYLGIIANYFTIDNKAYFIHDGGGYWYVLCFDLKTMKWEKKKNITIASPYQNSYVSKERIKAKNKNYFLFGMYKTDPFDEISRYESIAIWEYKDTNDSWSQLSTYPGLGNRDFTSFTIDNKVYIGGGLKDIYNDKKSLTEVESVTDFWEYNIVTKEWKRIKDLPYSAFPYYDYINSTTTSDDKNAFVFTTTRQLWKYDTANDNWMELTPLKQGPYTRTHGKLLYKKNKLYLTGTYVNSIVGYSPDVWEYDLTSNKWELFDVQEYYFDQPYGSVGAGIPAFIYEDILYLGCGTLPYAYEKDLFYKVNIK